MKAYHLVLLFLVFFLAAVIKTDMNIGRLRTIEQEKEELTVNLDSAAWDAVNQLSLTGVYGKNHIRKNEVVKDFFSSLYSSMGIMYRPDAMKMVDIYIPVILLCDTDGYYIYYYDKYKTPDGTTDTKRIWTEKMPYYYKDENFVYLFTLTNKITIYDRNNLLSTDKKVFEINYKDLQTSQDYEGFRAGHSDSFLLDNETFELVRKQAIINQLEKVMAYYTNKHNEIARQNGITYQFSFPAGQEEWGTYVDDVGLLVVFQGYPYTGDQNYTFNKIASCGANVVRKAVYYVEKKGWYYLVHKAGCPKLKDNPNVLSEPFDHIEECIKMGAYCDDCMEHGARAPEIK